MIKTKKKTIEQSGVRKAVRWKGRGLLLLLYNSPWLGGNTLLSMNVFAPH